MLAVQGLNQYYGGSHTLRDVAFDVPAGACTALLGRNGVGKTTLLKCLMGVLPMRSGKIGFAGASIANLPPYARAALGIGYVPQGRDIFPRLSVQENLQMGLAAKKANATVPDFVFDMFPVLKQMLNRRGGDLSGGQQQQLAIGRALVLEPTLLILDEPTEGIQPNIVHEIGDILLALNRDAGLTLLLVEQKLPFARRVASDFYVLEKGRRVAAGPIDELTAAVVHEHLSV
jgi:urea transport system ATP-binding protein